jgi:hypothetical protein
LQKEFIFKRKMHGKRKNILFARPCLLFVDKKEGSSYFL